MRTRKRNRLKGFDYSQDGCYFTTSNCKHGIHYFGEVVRGEMVLNEFGEIVKQQILWLEKQYPYLKIHNWVVMPNHVHFLLEIDRGRISADGNWERTGRDLSVPITSPIKIKSISSLMGAFKTTSSKHIHLAGRADFAWHRSFHDHIVRHSDAFRNMDRYITNNPKNWGKDKFNGNSNKK